jgi:hypothetical protein
MVQRKTIVGHCQYHCADHKDQQALQVVMEKMQAQVPSVLVLLEQLGHKDQQVLPDQKVKLVQLDHKDQLDLQVLILEQLDLLDQKVTPVQLVRKVLRAMPELFPQFNL